MAKPQPTPDRNRDPITGTPGAHPTATGIGTALGGAAVGVAAGAVGGPLGAAAGAVVGGVAGGIAGTVIGEEIDPTEEEKYWQASYPTRPYYTNELPFETVSPAYQYGWEARRKYGASSFDEVENSLEQGWEETRHDVRLGWEKARCAVRDAWNHAGSGKSKC